MGIVPSPTEWMLLFQLPMLLALLLAVRLLFGWRRFVALFRAIIVFAIYLFIGFNLLRTPAGFFMLLFSGWVGVTLLAVALFASTRLRHESDKHDSPQTNS